MISALAALMRGESSRDDLTESIREAFLALGSETPDNLAALRSFDVGHGSDGDQTAFGLRLAGSKLMPSDIAYELESLSLPPELAKRLPEMTEQHWEAFGRLTTLLYIALCNCEEPSEKG